MTSAIAVLEQEITAGKVALSESLHRLEDKAHALVDWRARLVKHPWTSIGLAVIAGGILGVRGRTRQAREALAADRTDARWAPDHRAAPPSLVFRALEALGTMAAMHVLNSLRHPPKLYRA